MPRVPRSEGPVVQTAPLRVPMPRGTEGPAAAAAMVAGGLADGLAIVEREIQAADEVRAQGAELELAGERDAILSEVAGVGGDPALELIDKAPSRLQQRASAIEAKLHTPQQREMFRQRAARYAQDVGRTLASREQTIVRQQDQQSTEGILARQREAIASAAADPERVTELLGEMQDTIRRYALRPHNAFPAEKVDQLVTEATAQARAVQLGRLISGRNLEVARAVLERHGAELTTEDRDRLTAALGEQQAYSQVNTLAQRLLEQDLTESQAEAALGALDIGTRQQVRKVYQVEIKARADAKQADHEAAFERAANAVDGAVGRLARDVVDPLDWAALSVPERNALESRADAPQNNNRRWLEFFALTPEQVAALPESEFNAKYWAQFDRQHRGEAERIRRDAQKDPTGSSGAAVWEIPFKDRVENAARLSKIIPADQSIGTLSAADRVAFIRFQDEASRLVRTYASTLPKGVVPSAEDMEKIVNAAAVQQVFRVPKAGADAVVGRYQLSADQFGNAYVPIATLRADPNGRAIEERLANRLRGRGTAVTDARIEQLRAAELLGDDDRFTRILNGGK